MKSKPCKEKRNLFENLSEAEDDVKAGRIAPMKDTFEDIRRIVRRIRRIAALRERMA